MTRRYRLAKVTADGTELTDWDVLTAEELAEDYGMVPRRSERVHVDPGMVAEVVRLQGRSA